MLTYLAGKDRGIRSHDGARFVGPHGCKISDTRIFSPFNVNKHAKRGKR